MKKLLLGILVIVDISCLNQMKTVSPETPKVVNHIVPQGPPFTSGSGFKYIDVD